jgi:hypothetical protein
MNTNVAVACGRSAVNVIELAKASERVFVGLCRRNWRRFPCHRVLNETQEKFGKRLDVLAHAGIFEGAQICRALRDWNDRPWIRVSSLDRMAMTFSRWSA